MLEIQIKLSEQDRPSTACFYSVLIWATTWQNQQSECALSEDSDQPGHPPSLISLRLRSMGS